MLTASEIRYIPAKPGYIILQDKDGLYYYVNRTLYDEAVILEDRYGNNIDVLRKLIGGNADFSCIEIFVTRAPRSISILGYFLALLADDIDGDYLDIIGAVDLITANLDPRVFIKQPVEIRQSVNFSLNIRDEYEESWELFFDSCYDFEWVSSTLKEARTGAYSTKRTVHDTVSTEYENDDDSDEDDEEDPWGDLMAQFEQQDKDLEEKTPALEELPTTDAVIAEAPPVDGGNGMSVIRQRRAR